MKAALFALAALLVVPTFASAGDRYRDYGRSRDHYHGHYDRHRHHSHSSWGFSVNYGSGYYGGYHRPVYRETYYRPVYRDYCPPTYYRPAPVYRETYYAPVRYYDRDCGYYSRPTWGFSFGYSRY